MPLPSRPSYSINPWASISMGPGTIDAALTQFCPTLASALAAVNAHAAYVETDEQKSVAWEAELGSTVADLIDWFNITAEDVLTELHSAAIAAATDGSQWLFVAAANSAGYQDVYQLGAFGPFLVTPVNGPNQNIAEHFAELVGAPASGLPSDAEFNKLGAGWLASLKYFL